MAAWVQNNHFSFTHKQTNKPKHTYQRGENVVVVLRHHAHGQGLQGDRDVTKAGRFMAPKRALLPCLLQSFSHWQVCVSPKAAETRFDGKITHLVLLSIK